MIVGVLKENKAEENRVSLSPGGVEFMRQNGHSVLVQKNAGNASGFTDPAYKRPEQRSWQLQKLFLKKPK